LSSFAAAPNVTRVSPSAAAPGKTTIITFLGDNLQGPVDLWTSFPCEVAPVKSSGATAFELSVPKQTAPGVGAIRLVTTNGLSSLQLLLIDSLPTIEAVKTNRSQAFAQRLSGQIAVDGVCEELRSDFYRFPAKKGERISIEAVAQRLGSPLDPLIRLLDAQGRELAANDDATGLGADAKIEFRCPKTGDYLVEVRDTRHAGGPRHRYRLRIGDALLTPLPFLSSPEVSKLTESLDPPRSVNEVEPNDDGVRAHVIRLPVELTGCFERPGDRDVFEFQARKGERVVFSGRTRSLGSACDLFLQLQTTNGVKLAEANATGADEGVLTNRFKADGACRLVVEELNRNGGPGFAYHIAVRELKPGFALSTETERLSVPTGDAIEIEVKPARREYDGPIQLTVVGLPEGFSVSNAVITAKTNPTKLRISVPTDLALGDFFLFSIVGSAVIDGATVRERTSTLPALRTLFPELRYPPAEVDGLIALSISESKSATPQPQRRRRR
jgi:hypothetical protein